MRSNTLNKYIVSVNHYGLTEHLLENGKVIDIQIISFILKLVEMLGFESL